MARRQRRGQAEPLTVMILVSATLIVALLLFSYFTGIYRGQQVQMGLVEMLGVYSNRLSVYVEASLTGESVNGDSLYCDVVSIVNTGGDTLRVYLTILPLARSGTSYIVTSDILYVPVDYNSPYSAVPLRTVYIWILNDTDRDGVVELVGSDGAGGLTVVSETVPSCQELYDRFLAGTLYDLPLPPDSDDPNLGYEASRIMLSPGGLSLQELAALMVPDAPDTLYVPMWNVTVPPSGKVQLYLYTMSQEPVETRGLVLLVYYEGYFYIALLQPMS